MNGDILRVFEQMPAAISLYEAVESRILALFADVRIKVSKTQVGFANRYGFAYVWPPIHKRRGLPGTCVILTLGLARAVDHPRIWMSTEPYPGRFTHHIVIAHPEELDEQIDEWLREAYAFSMVKGRR